MEVDLWIWNVEVELWKCTCGTCGGGTCGSGMCGVCDMELWKWNCGNGQLKQTGRLIKD